MRAPAFLLALALALPGAPALGQDEATTTFDKGYDFVRLCESRDTLNRGLCLGIVIGLTNGSQVTTPRAARLRFCEPYALLLGERRNIVVEYIRQHPEREHLPVARLFYEALAQAFPCQVQRWRGP